MNFVSGEKKEKEKKNLEKRKYCKEKMEVEWKQRETML